LDFNETYVFARDNKVTEHIFKFYDIFVMGSQNSGVTVLQPTGSSTM